MTAVKSLADGHTKLTFLTAAPANIAAVTILEAFAGTDASGKILFSDYKLGPTGSNTIDEKPLSVAGNFQALDASNYEAAFTIFRYYDTTDGQPDTAEDAVYAAATPKGTIIYAIERESYKLSTEAWAPGDEYNYYELVTDDPMRVDMKGYVKRRVPCAVSNASIDGVLAGS